MLLLVILLIYCIVTQPQTEQEVIEAVEELLGDCNFSEKQEAKVWSEVRKRLKKGALADEIMDYVYSTLGGTWVGFYVLLLFLAFTQPKLLRACYGVCFSSLFFSTVPNQRTLKRPVVSVDWLPLDP